MKLFVFYFTIIILTACGSPEQAGGSGIEIPNAVTMVATHSDGRPVKNGSVKIIHDSKWIYNTKYGQSVVIDSMSTDNNGVFSFTPPKDEHIRIEIVSNNEGVSILYDSSESSVLLEAMGSIQFQWKPRAIVSIFGTSFSQIADSIGKIHFPHIPRQKAFLVGQQLAMEPTILTPFSLEPNENKDMGIIQALPHYLVIDDFEEKSMITQLAPYTRNSYWFSLADEQEGGKSTLYPSTAKGDLWSSAISEVNSFKGHSLKVDYHVEYSESESVYAILGCTLGNGIQGNAIDSISFMVYTDGDFSLFDGTHTLIHKQASTSEKWQRVSIQRPVFDSLGVHAPINVLQFVFIDTIGTVFQLDDFIVYGNPYELLLVE